MPFACTYELSHIYAAHSYRERDINTRARLRTRAHTPTMRNDRVTSPTLSESPPPPLRFPPLLADHCHLHIISVAARKPFIYLWNTFQDSILSTYILVSLVSSICLPVFPYTFHVSLVSYSFLPSPFCFLFPLFGCFAAFERKAYTALLLRQCDRGRESAMYRRSVKSPLHFHTGSVKRERAFVHLVVITRFNFVPDTPVPFDRQTVLACTPLAPAHARFICTRPVLRERKFDYLSWKLAHKIDQPSVALSFKALPGVLALGANRPGNGERGGEGAIFQTAKTKVFDFGEVWTTVNFRLKLRKSISRRGEGKSE